VRILPKGGRLDLNSARAVVGRHVNLHLWDGSVIVNVRVVEALHGSPSFLRYKIPAKRRMRQVPLRDVAWLEPLDPFLLALG